MITLYTFGPRFGLPDPSPFVSKAEVLLKLAGTPYNVDAAGFGKAPRGKLPFIDDGGTIVADSTMIRLHLEAKYGADFSRGLSASEQGVAWAMEKLCEDHLYWLDMRERWLVPANFDKGPRRFFDGLPALVRPIAVGKVRREVKRTLHGQGVGRLPQDELRVLSERAAAALSAQLGDKAWLMDEQPTGADASVWSFVTSGLCDLFESDVRRSLAVYPNLVAYRDRGMALWFQGPSPTG